MNNLPRDMVDLGKALSELPKEHPAHAAYQNVCESDMRRRRVLDLVQEALSQVRLDMKYLLFDNDCLRREAAK